MARRRAAAWLGCAVAWCSCCAADDQLELSLVLGNVTLPHDRAVMHCRWFEIAALLDEAGLRPALGDRPLTAVGFGIALHSAHSAAIVHHANVFLCAGRASERQFPHERAECSAGGAFVERPKGGGGRPA